MKTNIKLFAVAIAAMMAGSILFISCTKEIGLDPTSKGGNASFMVTPSAIPYFANEGDLTNRLIEIEANLDDLATFEDNLGYVSIGRLSDEFFDTIDFDSFVEANDFEQFMLNNSQFAEKEIEPDGAISYVPRFFHNRLRYVANTNGLFQVGDTIFRLVTHGMAFSHCCNTGNISSMSETEIMATTGGEIHYEPYPDRVYVECDDAESMYLSAAQSNDGCFALNTDTVIWNRNESNTMRIYSEFCYWYNSANSIFDFGIQSYCKTKILWFWVAAKRNISYSGNIVYHLRNYIGGSGPEAYEDECTEYTNVINRGSENGVTVRTALCPSFTYAPDTRCWFWIIYRQVPEWNEILRFKNINLNVHAASVEQTIVING